MLIRDHGIYPGIVDPRAADATNRCRGSTWTSINSPGKVEDHPEVVGAHFGSAEAKS
jgi:hypothetical protein